MMGKKKNEMTMVAEDKKTNKRSRKTKAPFVHARARGGTEHVCVL